MVKSMEKLDRGMMWNAHFKVLREMLEHHIKEEESIVFSLAKKILSNEEAEDLGLMMERRRQGVPDIQKRVRGASILHGSELHG